MDFVSYPRLQEFLDALDDCAKVLGNITFGSAGVFIDDVPNPGQKEAS